MDEQSNQPKKIVVGGVNLTIGVVFHASHVKDDGDVIWAERDDPFTAFSALLLQNQEYFGLIVERE